MEKTENIQELDSVDIKEKSKPLSVGIISLGCDKNRVDTEIMITHLKNAGYYFTDDETRADIIIINTCGFITSARQESTDTIEEMSEYRRNENYNCKRLVVTGCMSQKWSNEIIDKFPDVDIILGIDQYQNIASILKSSFETNKKIVKIEGANTLPYIKERIVTTPIHYAYLKIADGCDNYCTFCTIPYIRGRYRSKSISDILEEAKYLVSAGATELILVAQDISRYGIDKTGKSQLVNLIRELSKIKNLVWIRLLYCYPEMITDELFDEMMNNKKLCNYLDIPLQHISNSVLKRMNRKTTTEDIEKLINKVKSLPQFVAIRTTLMTGFPGETNEDFKELCEFVENSKLLNVGFFAYSREDGTVAGDMSDQVDEEVKEKRLNKLIQIQKRISKEINKSFVGQVLDVCYEGIDFESGLCIGRSQYQAPDVDTLIFFTSKESMELGRHYNVKITKIYGSDLKGETVYE